MTQQQYGERPPISVQLHRFNQQLEDWNHQLQIGQVTLTDEQKQEAKAEITKLNEMLTALKGAFNSQSSGSTGV